MEILVFQHARAEHVAHEVAAHVPEFSAAAHQLYRNIMRATLA